MTEITLQDAQTMWVLIPHKITDGEVVYKKCRIKHLTQKTERWSSDGKILAMYADFIHDKNEGLVTLTKVEAVDND